MNPRAAETERTIPKARPRSERLYSDPNKPLRMGSEATVPMRAMEYRTKSIGQLEAKPVAMVHSPHTPVTIKRMVFRPNLSASMAQIGPKSIRAALPSAFNRPSWESPSPNATMIWGKNVLETPPSELSMDIDAPSAIAAPRRPRGGTKSASLSVSSPSTIETPRGVLAIRSSVPETRLAPQSGSPSGVLFSSDTVVGPSL
jgi:hypothetical protein